MSVGQLRRITFRFAGDGFNTQGIDVVGRGGGEHHLITQLGKECKPVGIVFIHIQNSWNPYSAAECLIRCQRLVMFKKPLVFIFIQIRYLFVRSFPSQTPFAAVARDELAAAGKAVDRQETVVGTSFTASHRALEFQMDDIFQGEHGGLRSLLVVFPGDEGGAKSSHNAGDIGTHCLTAGYPFEASQNGIVIKGSALNDYVCTEILWIGQLDHLQQGVFNDGDCQSG